VYPKNNLIYYWIKSYKENERYDKIENTIRTYETFPIKWSNNWEIIKIILTKINYFQIKTIKGILIILVNKGLTILNNWNWKSNIFMKKMVKNKQNT